jgi:hypothetical protein
MTDIAKAKARAEAALAAQSIAAHKESAAQEAARSAGKELSKARRARIEAARIATEAQRELEQVYKTTPKPAVADALARREMP